MKKQLVTIGLSLCAYAISSATLPAATLATASFDTDSYIFAKTNNAFGPQTTLAVSLQGTPGHPHFNFGVIEFDVSSLSLAGNKFLQLSSIEYVTGQPGNQTTSTSGSSTVQLVALGESWDDYQASSDGAAWYDANVQNPGVTVVGTFNFNDQSTRYVDVTSTVNSWINIESTNNGFALFSTSGTGNVELASMSHASSALQPALVDSVPEPSSSALISLSCFLLFLRRSRKS